MSSITIAACFNGPPGSGNGGYTSGLIAAHIGDAAVVTLRRPPPLDQPMQVRADGDGIIVVHGDTLIAEAAPSASIFDVPDPVPFDQAAAVSAPADVHPFPGCFVCGPLRAAGDGLRIFAGAVPGTRIVAAPWIPDAGCAGADGDVASEFVWAALDCPGGFVGDRDFGVLGRLDARVYARPRIGERCVLAAWQDGERTERKWIAGTALYGEDGSLLGAARSTWIIPRPA